MTCKEEVCFPYSVLISRAKSTKSRLKIARAF